MPKDIRLLIIGVSNNTGHSYSSGYSSRVLHQESGNVEITDGYLIIEVSAIGVFQVSTGALSRTETWGVGI